MTRVNHAAEKVWDGQFATVMDGGVDPETGELCVAVRMDDGRVRRIGEKEGAAEQMVPAVALTVYKSQGATVDRLFFEAGDPNSLTAEVAYVGISRGRYSNDCVMLPGKAESGAASQDAALDELAAALRTSSGDSAVLGLAGGTVAERLTSDVKGAEECADRLQMDANLRVRFEDRVGVAASEMRGMSFRGHPAGSHLASL